LGRQEAFCRWFIARRWGIVQRQLVPGSSGLMRRDVSALLGYLAERATMRHEFGRKANDCLSFVAGAVKAQTGKDPARGLQWKSQATALSLLNKLGGVLRRL
jgi:hypothetical protein